MVKPVNELTDTELKGEYAAITKVIVHFSEGTAFRDSANTLIAKYRKEAEKRNLVLKEA